MHALDTVKLASLLSVSAINVASEKQVADALTNQFWKLAKCREQRWRAALAELKGPLQEHTLLRDKKLTYQWSQFQTIAEEVIISELLLKNYLALIVGKHGHNEDVASISKIVLAEHVRIRKFTESFFDYIPERNGKKFKQNLLKMFEIVKDGSDFLLAHQDDVYDNCQFAFNSKLLKSVIDSTGSYSNEVLNKVRIHIGQQVHKDLKNHVTKVAFTPDLNKQIVECVKSCFVKTKQKAQCAAS